MQIDTQEDDRVKRGHDEGRQSENPIPAFSTPQPSSSSAHRAPLCARGFRSSTSSGALATKPGLPRRPAIAVDSFSIRSSSFFSRAVSVAKSMTPSSGRATVASPSTICADALGTWSSNEMEESRASRMISFSQAEDMRRESLLAPTSTQGIFRPPEMFISERTERISEMILITHSISASALASPSPL